MGPRFQALTALLVAGAGMLAAVSLGLAEKQPTVQSAPPKVAHHARRHARSHHRSQLGRALQHWGKGDLSGHDYRCHFLWIWLRVKD